MAKKEKAPAKPKKSKAAVAEEQGVAVVKAGRFDLNAVMSDALQEIEKKTGLSSNGFGRHCARLSTGLVALDMYLDGGLIPGGWYTTAGPEQSAKSTLTMTLVAACIKQRFNGVGALFDYEGSSDEDYIVNMMKNFGITNADRSKIFGVYDPNDGKCIVRGAFRYYDPTNGEAFFQYMQMLRRRLPDKTVTEKGEAYYVFEHTVKNKKMLAGQYDLDFLRLQNLLRVPAADTSMQALVVVDSYPAMLPDQQDDDDPSGAMALQARMFSDGIKRFRGGMRRKMMTILGVNQLRERPAQQHGDPNYEPCGNALKFYCVHPDTQVEYLNEDGESAFCTAHEYHERFSDCDVSERPPIRVPSEQGWAVPNEVFETDGGKYAGQATHIIRTARKALRGSAGHSVLTATKVNVPHPYSDKMNGWSPEIELPADVAPLVSDLDDDEDTAVWEEISAPRVGWSRLANIRYRDNDVWAFTDTQGLEPHDVNVAWNEFIKELTPHFHKLYARWTDHDEDVVARLAAFNDLDSQWLMSTQGISAEQYDIAFQQFSYIEELVNVYLNYTDANPSVPERIVEIAHAEAEKQTDRYIDFSVGGSWFSAGIISHNSDVRIRVMPRAVPEAFKNCNPQRGVIEEPSVEFGPKRVDRYKFISGRTIKNKLGGIPNQEFWARIWEADGKGNARGFDPVYDSYFYLKTIGLLVGQRNKMKFKDPCPLSGARRAITWQELKLLISGTTAEIKELCADLSIKPFNLRTWCFKYCKSEEGRQRCRDSIVEKQQASAESDDE